MEDRRVLWWVLGAAGLVILLGIFVAWMGVPGAADVPNLSSAEYLKRGNELYAQGRFADAAKEYELALRVDGTNVSARVNLGNAYFSLERLDDAAREFKAALQQSPNDADVHSNLAAVLIRQGKIEEALTEAQKAELRSTPTFAINRALVFGAQPYEVFKQVIEQQLAAGAQP